MKKNLFTSFILTIGISLLFTIIIIIVSTKETSMAIKMFFLGPFTNRYFFGNMITTALPLICTGLATSIAFSSGVFNVGLQGQLFVGALAGTYFAYCLPSNFPVVIATIAVLIVSFFAGGAAAHVSTYLENKLNVSLFLSSILLSNAYQYIVIYVLEGPFHDPYAGFSAASPYINERFMFIKILPPSDLHIGLFIAFGLAFVYYFLMERGVIGYELKIIGKNPLFAYYGGISNQRIATIIMFISGGLAGVAGAFDIFGVQGRMIGMLAGYGWTGIAVAIVARYDPILIVLVSIFFSYIQKGAEVGALFSDITVEMAQVIQGTIFFLVTAEGLLDYIKRSKKGVNKHD